MEEYVPQVEERTALLVVDVQYDFLPEGALGVPQGSQILAAVRKLLESPRFATKVATQDWHPAGHISFASSHKGRKPFETIQLYDREQILWPDHCIQGSQGAELHRDLPWNRVSAIIRKGSDPKCDSYSGFRDNWNAKGERPQSGMSGYLGSRGIREVVLCGLARDFCVLWSAQDAVVAGFSTTVLWDATRPVDPSSDQEVRRQLQQQGVRIVEEGRSAP